MTQDEIIEMAREAGAYSPWKVDDWAFDLSDLQRFAKLVADVATAKERERMVYAGLDEWLDIAIKTEREACAKVCEEGVDTEHPTVKGHIMKGFGASPHLAEAIRARGEPTLRGEA